MLLRKSSLKDFRLKRLFLREDVSHDYKLCVRKSISSVHPGDSTQGPSVSAASNTSPASAALTPTHSFADSPPSSVVPVSTTAPSRVSIQHLQQVHHNLPHNHVPLPLRQLFRVAG